MVNVTEFTGGRRCIECGEQISPARVRIVPKATRCTPCEKDRERLLGKVSGPATLKDVVIIKG